MFIYYFIYKMSLNINIDSHQIFPNYDINKINKTICFSDNPKTGLFLKENPHLISVIILNSNNNDWAIDFLINNSDKIDYNIFSKNNNDNAVKYLLKNKDKINWNVFSENSNDNAVIFLLNNNNNNKDKINWSSFSSNKNDIAVNYLLNNKHKIDLYYFSRNKNIKLKNSIFSNQKTFNDFIELCKKK